MSEDLIKREDAINAVAFYAGQRFATIILNKVPAVDRPQGKWIEVDDSLISCKCSVCGWEAHKYEDDVYGMPYCPNCGSPMKGVDDE